LTRFHPQRKKNCDEACCLVTAYLLKARLDSMELARLLGFVGDGVTFLSGVLLSWDAIRSESEFVEATDIMEGMKHPVMQGVKVEIDKVIVTNDKGVERLFRRRASRKAIIGTFLLTAGFLFLLGSRLAEPSHLEIDINGYHIDIK
jgi:hypothetical protein